MEEPPPPPKTGVATPVAEGVIVTVRKPGDDAADAPVELTLAPGAQTTLAVTVRNQSGIVDNYDLELRGMPKDWWTMTPPTVYLVPYGAAGGSYEQEAVLRLHPPRSPEAEARRWPITIVARSRAREEDVGSATAAITIEPYVEIESELRPEIATGRHGAEFAIAVRNAANAQVDVVVGALDNEGECTFKFQKPQLSAPPGRRDGTAFDVRPPKQMIFGRTKERRFTVTAQAVGSEVAARPQPAVFRQKPWIPAWVLPIVPLLIAAGVAIWLLRPNTTKVPDLTGATVFVAQQKLEAAGLKLGQKEPEETSKSAPGTILATIPAAGKEVDKGKEVIVQVAVGSTEVEVPQLIGLSVQAAETRLKKTGLELGRIDPPFDDAAKAIVNHQAPDPGAKLNKGESVDLALNPETANTATTATTPSTGTDTAGSTGTDTTGGAGTEQTSTGGSPTGTPSAMPALAGLAVGAAINKLGSGVKTEQVEVFDLEKKAGDVISVVPAEGEKLAPGQKVILTVSKGPPPPIAYSSNGKILFQDAEGKSVLQEIADDGALDGEPAWNDKGDLLAYQHYVVADKSSSIWVVDPSKPQTGRQLTGKAGDPWIDRRPTFSPNGQVIAFVRASLKAPKEEYTLCFKRARSTGVIPLCIPRKEGVSVLRPDWSPDGHAISVILLDANNDSEVALYTSAKKNSPIPSDWNYKGTITEPMHPKGKGNQARYAAWSPDGKQLAVSANWRTKFFHLELIPMNEDLPVDGKKPESVTRVHSCDLSWRSDGLELVYQQSDTCETEGSIFSVDLSKRPPNPKALMSGGHPAWSPAVANP